MAARSGVGMKTDCQRRHRFPLRPQSHQTHYGFSAEELDFIINYDIKHRLGRESEEAE